MNIDRIIQLAEHLEKGARVEGVIDAFDMCEFKSLGHCKTVGCIAGHAMALFAPDRFRRPRTIDTIREAFKKEARRLLEISRPTAEALFTPDETHGFESYKGLEDGWRYEDVTPGGAAKVLRNLVETGEVDWYFAFSDN